MIRIKDSVGNTYYLWRRANGNTALTGHSGVPNATSNVFGRQTALLEMAFEDARNDEEMLSAAREYLPNTYSAEPVRIFESREPAPDRRLTVVVTDVFGNRGYVHRQANGAVEYRSETGVNLALPGKDSFLTECRLAKCHVPMEMKVLLDGSFKKVELLEKDIAILQERQAQVQEAVKVLTGLVAGTLSEDEANDYLYEAGFVQEEADENTQIGDLHLWINTVANVGGSREEASEFLEYYGVAVDPMVAPAP
jgi:hypothetical protein